jgi:hypothetical protein
VWDISNDWQTAWRPLRSARDRSPAELRLATTAAGWVLRSRFFELGNVRSSNFDIRSFELLQFNCVNSLNCRKRLTHLKRFDVNHIVYTIMLLIEGINYYICKNNITYHK